MKALITGASSGIGRDIARYLSKLGYDLVIVARNTEALETLKKELNTNVEVISLDLSIKANCYNSPPPISSYKNIFYKSYYF